MLSQSRTTSSERSDLVVLGTAKLRHRNSISWSTMRGRDVSRRILMEFTIASNEIQYIDSQLKFGLTEEKCIEMDKMAQENHSYFPSSDEYERYKKNWNVSLNKSGRNAPIKECQIPMRSWNGQQRTRRLFLDAYSPRHSDWNFDIFSNLLLQDCLQLMAICCNRRGV